MAILVGPLCCKTSVCNKGIDETSIARIAARIFYQRFVSFRFMLFRPQSCGAGAGFTKMASIEITSLQILARANNSLRDSLSGLDLIQLLGTEGVIYLRDSARHLCVMNS